MKKRFLTVLCAILALLLLLSSCSRDADVTDTDTAAEDTLPGFKWQNDPDDKDENSEYRDDNGVVLNIDCDAVYYFARTNNYDYTNIDAKARTYFNQYTDKGLSDILYNLDGAVPTETHEFSGDVYTEEGGEKVFASVKGEVSNKIFYELNYDPFATWIGLCRENGINPWLSFRMNDVHYANDPNAHHDDFYYEAQENGWFIGSSHSERWSSVGASAAWFPYALDYSVPEVRQHFLDYIDEMLGRYDVYGIELDWQRTIWCFSEDDASNCAYIDEFMNDLDAILKKYETRYGHEIKTMARINRDIDENVILGFDVIKWAQNDWIDVVVPSPYWGVSDSDMPIAKWVDRLKGYDVEVYAALEDDTFEERNHNIATLAAMTAQYLSQGAEKMYLFNFMEWDPIYWEICSSMKSAMSVAYRSYVVTQSNSNPYGDITFKPLPMECSIFNESNEITLNHGTLDYGKNLFIYVGVSGVPDGISVKDLVKVYFGDAECSYSGESTESYVSTSVKGYKVYKYVVPMDKVTQANSTVIRFVPEQDFIINYVELMNGKVM